MEKNNSIKKACTITDRIFSNVLKHFKKFRSEKQVARFIYTEMKKFNVKKAFPVIVSTGKNASDIHHKPSKDWFKGFCVIDFGVRVNGYCSDMTRTVYLGKPAQKEIRLYNLLLNAQTKCIAKAKAGISCKKLARYNVKLLGREWRKMIHALGHGVGKKIHIKPRVSLKSPHILQKGDVITIEPGLYFKGRYGLRIEDTLVVGGEVLTGSEKKLIVVS